MMNTNKISTTHSNIQYVTYFVNVHHYALETRSSPWKEPHILGPLQDERRGPPRLRGTLPRRSHVHHLVVRQMMFHRPRPRLFQVDCRPPGQCAAWTAPVHRRQWGNTCD